MKKHNNINFGISRYTWHLYLMLIVILLLRGCLHFKDNLVIQITSELHKRNYSANAKSALSTSTHILLLIQTVTIDVN